MRSMNYAYVNGRFLAESEAKISIFDRGFLYGDGVFETIRVYRRNLVHALDHLDRLFASLDRLGIHSIFSPEELRAACNVLIERNGLADGVARIYYTRDSLVITARHGIAPTPRVRSIISDIRVNPQLSRLKTANRLPYILAQQEAARVGVEEAVLLNTDDRVVEFCNANLFVVHDRELVTPPLADGPLPGITRHYVLRLARQLEIPVHERSFGTAYLKEADEVFATNSVQGIMQVVSWGSRDNVTRRLRRAYDALVEEEFGAE